MLCYYFSYKHQKVKITMNTLHKTTKTLNKLLVTQFLTAFNDNFFKSALAILVTYKLINAASLSSEIIVTIASCLFIMPFFIFSALAGQLADKFEKATVIKVVKFFEIPITLLATIGFYTKSVSILLIALLLLAIQFTFFGPVKYSFLPERLPADELLQANGFLDASTFLAILFGTMLGGAAIFFATRAIILLGIIMTVIAMVSWIVSLFIPKALASAPELKVDLNIFRSSLTVVRKATVNNRQVFLAILGASWFWLFGFVLITQMPVFVANVLFASSSVATLFFTLFTIGIAIGSLLCNRLMKGEVNNTYIPVSILGMSVFLFDFILAAKTNTNTQFTSSLYNFWQFLSYLKNWRMLMDLFLLAICGGIYIVPIYVTLQAASELKQVSRIIAANNIINSIFMSLGMLAVWGLLALHFSLITIFTILAYFNLLVAIYSCKLIPDAVTRTFIKWLLRVIFRVKVTGLEHIKTKEQPYLVIANHSSLLDAILIAAFFPKKLIFAIDSEIAKTIWVKFLFGLVKLYPLDSANPMATKGLINELKSGSNVLIFPEGRITKTGGLMKIHAGAGLIAAKSGAKILPIRIDGTQYSLFSYLKNRVKRKIFPKISLIVMPAKQLTVDSGLTPRQARQALTDQLYDIMTNLLFISTNCEQTIFSKILEARRTFGRYKKIIFDYEQHSATYQKLLQITFIFANLLRKISARKENIGVLLPNCVATIGVFCGCQITSRIPVMMNYSAGRNNIITAIKAANINTIITSHKFITQAKLEELISVIQPQTKLIYLEDAYKNFSLIDKFLAILFANIPNFIYQNWLQPAKPTDPAVVLFTSGSESTPKGVVLTHKNLLSNCAQLTAIVDFNGQDTVFNALPNFHSFGLTGGMLLPLLYGVKSFYFPNPLQYRAIPKLIYDVNATILFGTDTFLANYALHSHNYDFYSIRYVFAGAEKLRDSTQRIWHEKFGIRIFEGYGATEASPVIGMNTPMYYRPGTVGRILPGIEYKIEKIEGVNEGGKLLIKGVNITAGYYEISNPGVTQPLSDVWYDTGDIISIDSEGYVKVIGRLKRFAKIAGEMISLTKIESILAKTFPNSLCVAINAPDLKKGEKIILFTTNNNLTRDAAAKALLAEGAAELMLPKEIIVVEEIPLLGSGKTDYLALQQDYKHKELLNEK